MIAIWQRKYLFDLNEIYIKNSNFLNSGLIFIYILIKLRCIKFLFYSCKHIHVSSFTNQRTANIRDFLKNEFRLNDFKICSLQPFFCCPGLLTLFTLYIKWQRIHCLWVIKPLVYLGYSPSRPPCGTQSFTFCAILSSGKCVGNVVDSTIYSSPNEDRLTLPERIQLFKLWYLPRTGSPKYKLVLVFFSCL